MNQRTIAEKISCTGIGLHSGEPVQLTLSPARAGSGIVFVRTDLPMAVEIPARPESRDGHSDTPPPSGAAAPPSAPSSTCWRRSTASASTTCASRWTAPRFPSWTAARRPSCSCSAPPASSSSRRPGRGSACSAPSRSATAIARSASSPARELRISYAIDYLHPAIGRQSLTDLSVDGESFEREICRARTFGFLHEVQTLWKLGLARGGNLDNTVVLDEERVLNRDGVRFPDEFVRHKVLDLIGDLALLGMPLEGHVHVERGGHALHQRLLSELLASQRTWRVVGPSPAVRGERLLAVAGAGLS